MRRLLSSLARSSARATGRALSAHVVPDSLIPSWKTRKVVLTGYSLLTKAARKTKNKKGSSAAPPKGAKRPAPTKPKKKFDKNAWSQGRSIASPESFAEPRPSSPGSRWGSSLKKRASRLGQQLRDLRQEPRLVAQMGLDLLKTEYQAKQISFLSKVRKFDKKL